MLQAEILQNIGISVQSARGVAEALNGRYESLHYQYKGNDWFWEDPKGRLFSIDKNDFTLVIDDERVMFDAVFIAIHGTPVRTACCRDILT